MGGIRIGVVELDGAVVAEARAATAALRKLGTEQRPVRDVPIGETRQTRAAARIPLPNGVDREVPGRAGSIPIRCFSPERATGVYLHLHGGGWTLGSSREQDELLDGIANGADLAVVSVDYRLAPEHPFPAGPDDCEDAALWVLEHAKEEFGTDRVTIGGESAGADLAALTLLRLRDRHGISGAFSAANFSYGVFDLSMTPSQRRWGEDELVLSTPTLRWFGGNLLGLTPLQPSDPEISPLYADLQGLPPALFSVGLEDPLLDDSTFMAARWATAGGECAVDLYPEAPHAFLRMPIELSAIARARQIDFLRSGLAVT